MTRGTLLRGSLGIGIPLLGWVLAALRNPTGTLPSPFGDLYVLLAMLLLAMPISWQLAEYITLPKRLRPWSVLLAIVASLCPAMLPHAGFDIFAQVMKELAQLLTDANHPWLMPVTMTSTRLCLVVAAQFVWFVSLQTSTRELNAPHDRRLETLACMLLAIVPNTFFAVRRAEYHEQRAALRIQEDRIWLGWLHLEQAYAISGTERNNEREYMASRVANAIQKIQSRDLSPSATFHFAYVVELLALDQHALALQMLDAAVPANEVERFEIHHLRLAVAMREERWQDVLTLIQEQQRQDPRSIFLQHYDALAQALRGLNRWTEAEALYLKLIIEQPTAAGYWHKQLAKHYQLAGHSSKALKHYDLAREKLAGRNPSATTEIEAAIRQLRLATPACIIGQDE